MNGRDLTVSVVVDDQPLDPGELLEPVRVVRGRTDVRSQPRPAYAQVRTVALDGAQPPGRIGATVTVTVTPDGTPRRLFTGRTTDLSDVVSRAWPRHVTRRATTAVGPLGLAHRVPLDQPGLPQQYEGQRIRAALSRSLSVPWTVVPGTWTGAEGSWSDRAADVDASDVPDGTFLVVPVADTADSLAAAQAAADAATGMLHDRTDGSVRYEPPSVRAVAVAADTPTVLPAPELRGVTAAASSAQLVTDATVEYGPDDDRRSVTVADDDTAQQYGRHWPLRRSTILAAADDAQRLADALLAEGRNPRALPRITYRLAALTPAEVDVLAALELGDYVDVGQPWPVDVDSRGFVEQLTWNLTYRDPTVDVVVSPVVGLVTLGSWIGTPGRWRTRTETWTELTVTP